MPWATIKRDNTLLRTATPKRLYHSLSLDEFLGSLHQRDVPYLVTILVPSIVAVPSLRLGEGATLQHLHPIHLTNRHDYTTWANAPIKGWVQNSVYTADSFTVIYSLPWSKDPEVSSLTTKQQEDLKRKQTPSISTNKITIEASSWSTQQRNELEISENERKRRLSEEKRRDEDALMLGLLRSRQDLAKGVVERDPEDGET